eukprot:98939-Pyramimonas_sp.AAC.1
MISLPGTPRSGDAPPGPNETKTKPLSRQKCDRNRTPHPSPELCKSPTLCQNTNSGNPPPRIDVTAAS